MGCIALVRCVLVLRCGLAGVVWYLDAGFSLHPTNACRLFSLEPIEGQSLQKYTQHNGTTQSRYTPRDYSRQRQHSGKRTPEFRETHSSVLGLKRDQFQHRL
jgi:hypothetical protein